MSPISGILQWLRGSDQGETTWKWTRRLLGVFGFIFTGVVEATTGAEFPIAFYGILAGLLGLDFLLEAQGKAKGPP